MLDEGARAPHHVEPHQVAPVIRVFATLKRGERARRDLSQNLERAVAQFAEQLFGTDADVLIFD